MTDIPPRSDDHYDHLRSYAIKRKLTTVERLAQTIAQLEAEGRSVNTFTIKEVGGLNYMVYYRNREAFQLFQEHSTHLRQEREQKYAKQQATRRVSKRKTQKGQEPVRTAKVAPRDPLLDYKRPRLVELLHEARAERDEANLQVKAERAETEQHKQAEQVELEQRYHKLLSTD